MERINLLMPTWQINELKKLSKITDTSVSEHIRRATDMYLGSKGLMTTSKLIKEMQSPTDEQPAK